jgi:hypothetical protein
MVIVRFKATLIAIDQLFAAMVLGYPDETFSAAAHRLGKKHRRWRITEKLIDGLFFWEKKHCFLSYQSEWERKQYPNHYRT